MNYWSGKSVIVTGAASGIGLSISRLLSRRGAKVWLSDINADAVTRAADEIGGDAKGRNLDVRNASAFKALVDEVIAAQGCLDALFNNAGIGVGGEAHELDTSHFDKAVAVNITGVTNGIVSAYPKMAEKGSGLIVNTASAAGLMGVPLMSPYSMTKHAVVGLTTALRIEAAQRGVQVSALCPMAIETPILESNNPPDTAQVWGPDIREYLTELGGPPYPVEKFVNYAIKQIERNKGIIVAPLGARLRIQFGRFFPGVVTAQVRKAYRNAISKRPD